MAIGGVGYSSAVNDAVDETVKDMGQAGKETSDKAAGLASLNDSSKYSEFDFNARPR